MDALKAKAGAEDPAIPAVPCPNTARKNGMCQIAQHITPDLRLMNYELRNKDKLYSS
jgi:hypothetical protein